MVKSRIKVLPPDVVNKIAAGEVVERPASVVKELVENSIDAGSTRIFIFVKRGGLEEIRVVDNGIGMNEEEAVLAFKRHATSKISDERDLERITTLGFRGEALPSIASVSRIEMLTRPKESIAGTRLFVEGGKILKVEPAGCPPGTSISVRDLFYNTPARRKFLKGERQEFSYIFGVVEKYALNYENIHFKLVHNGRTVIDAPPGRLIDRIASLWGSDVAKDMVNISSSGRIAITGYVSKPYLTRRDKQRIVTFVNGRYVKNTSLINYILSGYGTLLFRDSYPYAVLRIDLPPEDVDVNVHPSKILVKFRNEEKIKGILTKVIWDSLTAVKNIPSKAAEKGVKLGVLRGEIKKERQMVFEVEKKGSKKNLFDYIARARVPGIEVLGQFDNTYIIAKTRDEIIIVDQHAAHERIRYEKFLSIMRDGKIQELIEPVIVELGPGDYRAILEIRDRLRDFCIIVDDFGEGTIAVRGIPPILKRSDVKDIIMGIIDLGPRYVDEKRDEVIKLISCKGAIKAGDKLSIYEMEDLVAQLLRCENPYTCPHGRPTMIRFTSRDLEKMFKRKE